MVGQYCKYRQPLYFTENLRLKIEVIIVEDDRCIFPFSVINIHYTKLHSLFNESRFVEK
jgi:hypothetical protein